MGYLYLIPNGAPSNTAAPTKVTTGTAAKTLLQVATPSTTAVDIIEWGISFDGSAAATPIQVELVDVAFAATVTALSAATVGNYSEGVARSSNLTYSTTGTGYTASAEGTASGTPRLLDYQLVAPSSAFVHQYPLGREPHIAPSRFLRIRVTAAAAVNAACYVIVEET